MIQEALKKTIDGKNLSYEEASDVMKEIMGGKALPTQIAAFLTSLHMKGETVEEISACAYVMREYADRVTYGGDLLEIVGTGGDGANSINISTISAIVAAAAGAKVTKHGNRAASSKCGAADCLEALGVNLQQDSQQCVTLLDRVGICFLFAQKYHSAMKYVGPVRKEIGIPTIFNILGPLTNPAHANLQLLGVYSEELTETMARVLSNLGVKRGMAVYGRDGLDEISVGAPTAVVEINGDQLQKYEITPEQFGFERRSVSELKGGTPQENAAFARDILSGKKGAGRDSVLLNAGAAIHIAKEVPIEEGIRLAAEMIDSGKALQTLNDFISVSNAS